MAAPFIPENFEILFLSSTPVFVSVFNETVPMFFDLLQSAPLLFSNLSLAIADVIDIDFGEGIDFGDLVTGMLADDFVTIANESCGISLSQEQLDNVTGLFVTVLPVFALKLQRFSRTTSRRPAQRDNCTSTQYAVIQDIDRCCSFDAVEAIVCSC